MVDSMDFMACHHGVQLGLPGIWASVPPSWTQSTGVRSGRRTVRPRQTASLPTRPHAQLSDGLSRYRTQPVTLRARRYRAIPRRWAFWPKYTDRLAEAGIEPSVGSVGDSYDNALAETVNGLYKTEVIHRRGPWRSFEAVEFATLEWVDWFNNRRLLEPIGNIPPAEAEQRYYAMLEQPAMAA